MPLTYPLHLPGTAGIRASEWGLTSNNVVHESPFTGQQQVISRVGNYWSGMLELPPMTEDQAAVWRGFVTGLKGQYGTFWAGDPDNRRPRGEIKNYGRNLLLNGGGEQSSNSYPFYTEDIAVRTPYPGVNKGVRAGDKLTVSVDLKVDAAAAAAGVTSYFTLFIIKNGVWWSQVYAHSSDLTYTRYTRTLTIEDNFDYIRLGLYHYPSTETAGLAYCRNAMVEVGDTASSYTDPIVVNGGGQTGDEIALRGLPVDTEAVIAAGDYFQVGTQLFQATWNASSDSNGEATVKIEPALRSSPADGELVIFDNPQGIFALTDDVRWRADQFKQFGMSFGIRERF
ncbi:MAG: hypothetical protein CMF31_05030 [Kordiimonas sp.]|nr:hypothetical protein [Kordiimonas sp.]|tara:strand:- start:665 stop:1684 length:1020 start_codon:yes stop_codon:yes gene_type:complete